MNKEEQKLVAALDSLYTAGFSCGADRGNSAQASRGVEGSEVMRASANRTRSISTNFLQGE